MAAYRFGHSQVRPGYIANFSGDNGEPFLKHIFDINADHDGRIDDLSGGKRAPRRFVDWQTFFDVGPTPPGHENLGASPKPNKRIDTSSPVRSSSSHSVHRTTRKPWRSAICCAT